jgi:hypothetical protein
MQALERAEGGSLPCGGVLEVIAWQPDLLSRACKSAQEGNKPGVGRVGGSVTGDAVVGDTEGARSLPCGAAQRSYAGSGPLPRAGAQLVLLLGGVAGAATRDACRAVGGGL